MEGELGRFGGRTGQYQQQSKFHISSRAQAQSLLEALDKQGVATGEDHNFRVAVADVEKRITPKTKAIIAVHLTGNPCDLYALKDLAKRHNLVLIEDCAQAWGARYRGKPIGTIGDIACFSLHPRKLVSTGDGGMITTANAEWDAALRLWRQHGMSVPDTARHGSRQVIFESYPLVGYNYRLTDIQAAVEDRRDVLVIMMGDVGTNYINLRGFQQQIKIARENLKAQKHNADIIQKRYEAGFVGGLDVANAKAQVATTEATIPVFESSARAAIYSLGVLLGREPAALAPDLAKAAPIPPAPREIPVGLPSELLRRRPDIRRAEAQIHAATARIGVATADLFPRFFLTGSFGVSTSDVNKLGSLANNKFWSFGPSVTWPIFAGGRIYWNIKIQDALQEQALLTYEKTVLTALKDVETALVAYAKQQETRKSLSEAVVNNRKAVNLATQLYLAGRSDFLNVLIAQRSLFTSEDALAQNTAALDTTLIALYKALGGGWEKGEAAMAGKAKP